MSQAPVPLTADALSASAPAPAHVPAHPSVDRTSPDGWHHALRRAAVRATLAPSIHNTQPWSWTVGGDVALLLADRERQLRVLDPTGRQMLISCGCALLNARVALAAQQRPVAIVRLPDPTRSDRVAVLSTGDGTVDTDLARLDKAIDDRHSNRRRFTDEPVPDGVIDVLVDAARREGAQLLAITRPDHRAAVARLTQRADDLELTDAAYRAELRAWTTADPARSDGVPASAVPHVTGEAHDDVPIRDFDTHGQGALPADTRSRSSQCLLLLGTTGDSPMAWIRAGEALERVLLEVTAAGLAASLFTQPIEVARTRGELMDELGLRWFPHVLLRIGYAPATAATRRRRLVEVISER